MSFRTLLGVSIGAALAVFFSLVVFSIFFVRHMVSGMFSPDVALKVDNVLNVVLLEQAGGLIVLSIVLSLGVFFVIGHMVAKPLRLLSLAMDAYATKGEPMTLPEVSGAPLEIRSLVTSLSTFVSRADEVHKRDTEMSRVKSDFISTAAHQFRTPLTGIRWALEALAKEEITESQRALVQSAVDKSHDLVSIVGTLLDISAIESGKYNYKFAPTDMSALVDEVLKDFTPAASAKKVSLFHAREEGEVPAIARADQERVKWVINNLVDNAIQYTPAEGTVRVSITQNENRVLIHVKDSGIGILSEDRSNIFERFYRAQNAISAQNKGNGLGLYIARTIATDHGGDLNFAANDGSPGTTFVLSLPVSV